MARPKNKNGIRAKTRKDGYQIVHFEQHPGHRFATPEQNRDKAIKRAGQNREKLINKKSRSLSFYCTGFFSKTGAWARRMAEKLRSYNDKPTRRGLILMSSRDRAHSSQKTSDEGILTTG
jgi:hypothetical protein